MNRRLQLVPIVGTGAAAAMIFNILPVFVGRAAETFGLSDSAAGWMATTYLAGFGVSSVSATLWLHRFGRKALAYALFLSAAVLLAAGATVESHAVVWGLLFVVGLVLGGLYTMSFMLAGEYPDATRAVGVKLGGEVVLGAMLLSLTTTLVYPAFGFAGILATLAIVLIAVSPCARFVHTGTGQLEAASTEKSGMAVPTRARFMLGALLLFTVAQAAVWSFVERAGARAEFDGSATGAVLSVAVLFGGAGSFAAGALSDRLGKSIPLIGVVLLYLAAMVLLFLG
ncbi:MAG: MFS transporter, partial [Gammaproteobacteria bacterium]|nr:MFS transporter [Gammaproteobacteria bacterium]